MLPQLLDSLQLISHLHGAIAADLARTLDPMEKTEISTEEEDLNRAKQRDTINLPAKHTVFRASVQNRGQLGVLSERTVDKNHEDLEK
jgi:hypothetical protein